MIILKKIPFKCSFDLDDTIFAFKNYYEINYGIPKTDLEITKNVVGPLMKDRDFWLNQPLIRVPDKVYCYCTSRMIPKAWIKKQIEVNNLPKAPIYQVFGVSLSKYPKLKISGAQVHIDDSIRVFTDLNKRGFPCLLIDSPHNQNGNPIGRIYSLDKEEIEETYNLFIKTMFNYVNDWI